MSWFRHHVNPHWMPDHSPKKLTEYEKRHGTSRVHEPLPEPTPKPADSKRSKKYLTPIKKSAKI